MCRFYFVLLLVCGFPVHSSQNSFLLEHWLIERPNRFDSGVYQLKIQIIHGIEKLSLSFFGPLGKPEDSVPIPKYSDLCNQRPIGTASYDSFLRVHTDYEELYFWIDKSNKCVLEKPVAIESLS